jgi:hypothetical protein
MLEQPLNDAEAVQGATEDNAAPNLHGQLAVWCSKLVEQVRGIREAGIVILDDSSARKIACAPDEMPLNRSGYAMALSQMRAAGSAVLYPLDRAEDDITEVIALPLATIEGNAALIVGLSALPADQVELIMAHLNAATGWVVHYLSLERLGKAMRAVEVQQNGFALSAELLDATSPTEARQAFTSLVARYLNASRVALVRRSAFGKMRLEAVSGEAKFDRQTRLNDLTQQAGYEALVRREDVIWRMGDASGSVLSNLASAHGDGAIASIPLGDAKGRMVEVLIIQWPSRKAMPDLSLWNALWILARPVLQLQDKSHRGFFKRNGAAVWHGLGVLFGPRGLKTKVITVLLIAAVIAVTVVNVPDTLRAETVIDDPDLRVISAPTDGFLESVSVLPGDTVVAGQEVARIDASDLRLREVELEAQVARHLAQASVSRRARDLGSAAVAEAEMAEAQARLDLARRDLENAVIRAQSGGLVLDGDLRQRIGSKITYGETLMQIAPRRGIELRVSVDNRNGAKLLPGMTGTLRLKSAPQDPLQLTVTRIKPNAETIDGELRFVGYADLAPNDLRLENGMQGIARLDQSHKPIWKVWIEPALEIAYLFFWRWLP